MNIRKHFERQIARWIETVSRAASAEGLHITTERCAGEVRVQVKHPAGPVALTATFTSPPAAAPNAPTPDAPASELTPLETFIQQRRAGQAPAVGGDAAPADAPADAPAEAPAPTPAAPVCGTCNGRRMVETSCGDPNCGDSTWDHECGDGYGPCPACSAPPAEAKPAPPDAPPDAPEAVDPDRERFERERARQRQRRVDLERNAAHAFAEEFGVSKPTEEPAAPDSLDDEQALVGASSPTVSPGEAALDAPDATEADPSPTPEQPPAGHVEPATDATPPEGDVAPPPRRWLYGLSVGALADLADDALAAFEAAKLPDLILSAPRRASGMRYRGWWFARFLADTDALYAWAAAWKVSLLTAEMDDASAAAFVAAASVAPALPARLARAQDVAEQAAAMLAKNEREIRTEKKAKKAAPDETTRAGKKAAKKLPKGTKGAR